MNFIIYLVKIDRFKKLFSLKNLLFVITFNSFLFLLLMIGIQNNSNSRKVNLILGETIKLPTGFIVGISFISGSITGTLLNINLISKK